MRRLWWAILIGVLGLSVVGCGFTKDRESAQVVADEYLTDVANHDLDKAMSLWDSQAFQKDFTEKEWRKLLASFPKKLGDMKGHKMVGWRVDKRRMAGMTGTFCTFTYEVTYAKYPSQEAITLFRPVGGDHFLVVGHHINCKGLLV